MRKTRTTLILFVTALLLAVPAAWADVPTNMNVQGKLTDPAGAPVGPGAWQFTFRIFDMEAGGTQIWPTNGVNGEEQIIVMGDDGLWTTNVGEDTALTEVVFLDTTRWLEVTVTNFIDPAEVMPRMKLNTNPFTYRAASAQQADRIGGLTPGDLSDQFVDIPGDTMSGILTVNAPNRAGAGSSFRSNNINDANSPTSLGPNTIAIIAEAASDGSEGKWGVVGYGKGADGITVGVYGEGKGDGSVTAGIYGSAFGGNATENYSGLFEGGDVLVQIPRTPGDSSVRLPDNAISDREMLNEPGLSQSIQSFPSFSGTNTVFVVDSVEINCPTSGYVVVSGQFGWVNVSHTNGITTELWCKIDKLRGSTSLPEGATVWRRPFNAATAGDFAVPMYTSRVFSESAGVKKYYLHYYNVSGTDATTSVGRPFIRAVFFPTLYGTTTLAENSNGALIGADASPAFTDGSQQPPDMPTQTITLEEHNARLEAEVTDVRARLKALEDRMSPSVTTSRTEER